jgi:hypothetical protein
MPTRKTTLLLRCPYYIADYDTGFQASIRYCHHQISTSLWCNVIGWSVPAQSHSIPGPSAKHSVSKTQHKRATIPHAEISVHKDRTHRNFYLCISMSSLSTLSGPRHDDSSPLSTCYQYCFCCREAYLITTCLSLPSWLATQRCPANRLSIMSQSVSSQSSY